MKAAMSVMLISCLFMAGCSVGMAMSGKKEPQLGAVRAGATRGEVELQLGHPVEAHEENGRRVDIYEYEIGNEPSAGRAIGHGVMDVLTLGLWEVAGTPIEGMQGEKKRLAITYDEHDIVTHVGSVAPPRKKQQPQTEEGGAASGASL